VEQLDAVTELRTAAEGVVHSYDAGDGPRWPAIETLDEVLCRAEKSKPDGQRELFTKPAPATPGARPGPRTAVEEG
jgi:hypothetical protein